MIRFGINILTNIITNIIRPVFIVYIENAGKLIIIYYVYEDTKISR